MHATLGTRTNLALIGLAALCAAAALAFSRPVPVAPAVVGAFLGAMIGLLQGRGLEQARSSLRGAETMMEVRQALASTLAGKRSIVLQWAGVFAILGVALWIRNPIGGFVSGYGLLMGLRDLLALRSVGTLASTEGP